MKRTLKRKMIILPAWDKTDADPRKNYGVHGVEMRWYVVGEEGAVQFVLFTGWLLPKAGIAFMPSLHQNVAHDPLPADIGYHSRKPFYKGQEPMDDCDILHTKCYYDGSSLNAQRYFDILITKGGDALWRALENYYKKTFERQVN